MALDVGRLQPEGTVEFDVKSWATMATENDSHCDVPIAIAQCAIADFD